MNLLVFSDSHGSRREMLTAIERQRALPLCERPEYILFLGDGLRDFDSVEDLDLPGVSLLSVKGNCDAFGAQDTPESRMPVIANYRVIMTHGHRLSVKAGLGRAVAFAAEKQADILLFGHTHNPLFKRYEKDETAYGVSLKKPLVLFNPGSVREGSFGSLKLSEKGVFASFGTI